MTSTPTPARCSRLRGGGGGGRGARRRRRTRRRRRRRRRSSSRPTGSRSSSRARPTTRIRQRGRAEDLHRQGGDQDRREAARFTRATTATSTSACRRVIDVDAGRFIVSRESPTEVPQHFLVAGRPAHAARRRTSDLMPGPHAREARALHGRARRRLQVPRQRHAAAELAGGQRSCRRSSGSTRASSRARTSTTARIGRSTRTRSRPSARGRWSSSSVSATPSSSPTRRSSARRGR